MASHCHRPDFMQKIIDVNYYYILNIFDLCQNFMVKLCKNG